VIIWHVPHDNVEYRDLGADYFTRRYDNPEAKKNRLIRELQNLGLPVEVRPAA
jgi:transposase